MNNKLKVLPLGIQTFENIIKSDCLYVDKTDEIYKLLATNKEVKYYFLSRPRRFGKSLLVSTLESIFKGEKDLFKDLWIYDKIDFKKYPIIKIDFNNIDMSTPEKLSKHLSFQLNEIARKYNIIFEEANDFKSKFIQLITNLSKIDKVVVLIDEYDKPLIDHIDNIPIAIENRKILKTFYGTLKGLDEHLHFIFFTGVSKFSKISIFSELNNLTDITMDENHSKIIGIDEEQLYIYFDEYIKILAEKEQITIEKTKKELKKWYNGYSWDSKNYLYNPYGLLLLFNKNEVNNYWFQTGTPTFLIKLIKEKELDIKNIDNIELTQESFDFYDIDNFNPYALLFQTGYLTIKQKIKKGFGQYKYVLGYPNMEVKNSLLKMILSDYSYFKKNNPIIIEDLLDSIQENDLKKFFLFFQKVFSEIPSVIFMADKEAYYHSIFYLILTLIGVRINCEVWTNHGRIDAVIENDDTIYIFEFKLSSVNIAIKQIKSKKYYEKYLTSEKKLVLVGVSFDIDERNIKKWKIKKIKT
ncbi:MAG: AAA family ATPase [Candidatus Sericytochromatia bacterium]